jgi:cyclopropane-fatty-acyl-phospholipid synthase
MHYAETLLNWRRRFMARRAEALALYDERFCRMWEYYLSCCEAAFRYQNVAVFQIQCARRSDTVPLTRAYIAERYEDLRMRETEVRAAAAAASSPSSDPVPIRKQRQ